jgi:N-acetylneuraminic acid mutarotase
MPEARYAHAACAIGSDIFVFGGSDELGGDQDSVFKYDTVANEWSTLAPMSYACSEHTASVLDGLVYILGHRIRGSN